MPSQGRIEPPDYQGILDGKPRSIHDGIRLLVEVGNLALQRIDRRRLIWQDVPYASGLFSASAGTWTVAAGDVTQYKYLFSDFRLEVAFMFETTTTSAGMGGELFLALPLNLSAKSAAFSGTLQLVSSGLSEMGLVSTRSGANATTLSLQRAGGTAWPSSETNTLAVRGSIALEIG